MDIVDRDGVPVPALRGSHTRGHGLVVVDVIIDVYGDQVTTPVCAGKRQQYAEQAASPLSSSARLHELHLAAIGAARMTVRAVVQA